MWDVYDTIKKCVKWIKQQFSCKNKEKAVVLISSTPSCLVTLKLCIDALGEENVIGVFLFNPDEGEDDKDAKIICNMFKITLIAMPINWFIREASLSPIEFKGCVLNTFSDRLKSCLIYSIAEHFNGLVVSDLNYTDLYISDIIKFGTAFGDLFPLKYFSLKEIKLFGENFKIPNYWLNLPDKDIAIKDVTPQDVDSYLYDNNKSHCNEIESLHQKNLEKWDIDNSFEE